jgi:peptide-methionine (R)-S-oxide reductase
MDRRQFIAGALATTATISKTQLATAADTPAIADFPPIQKNKDEWKALLTKQQYSVLFEDATERSWTSPLNEEKRQGNYICAACYLPLFNSDTKFDSGTGWPSFYQPIVGHTDTSRDWKLLIPRTEYHCARCGGHQGHVFNDGPRPTGQRWCNNGVALQFVSAAEALPELRT